MSLQNLKIPTRLGLGFGLVIVLAGALGLFALQTMTTLSALTENLYQHPMAVSNAALKARGDINGIRREVLTVVLSGTPEEVAAGVKNIDGLEASVYDDFKIMLAQFLGDKSQIEKTLQAFRDWKPARDQVLAAAREGRKDDAVKLALGSGGTQANQVRDGIDAVIAFSTNKATSFYKNAAASRDEAFHTTYGILGGTILLAFLIAFLITRSITRPIDSLRDTMVQLAKGDYRVDVPFTASTNEIGAMAQTVQVFKDNGLEKLRMDETEKQRLESERQALEAQRAREQAIAQEIAQLIDGVSKGDLTSRIGLAGKDGFYKTMSEGINRLTDTVQAAISDIARVLGALAEGDLGQRITKDYQGAFDDLKSDVNATSAKLADIVGRIGEVTEQISVASHEVSMGSADLSERTEQQASSLEETAASLEQLGATVRTSAENAQRANKMAADARGDAEQGGVVAGSAIDAMKHIAEASRKITDIIGVIDEIAFQTNLLALNAAVEAARAGDAGKGFAVVAQEVRVLAQRSAQASKEIKTLILNSDNQVQNGVELVRKAGDSLGGIARGVQQVAALISEIASASAEQASALQEINASVAAMDEMTQKNAALVEETTAAAQSMAGQASDLGQQVAFFKLGGDARTTAAGSAPRTPVHHAPPQSPARPLPAKPAPARKPPPPPTPARTQAAAKPAGAQALRHAGDAHGDKEWKEF